MENAKQGPNSGGIRITNIPIIDEGHTKLNEVHNRIKEFVGKGACKNDLADIFFALSYVFENHLIKEELYLKGKGYGNFDNHKSSHLEFIQGIERLKDNFEKDIDSTLKELDLFVGGWLKKHSANYNDELVHLLQNKK